MPILCLIGGVFIGIFIGAFLMAMMILSKSKDDDWGDKK